MMSLGEGSTFATADEVVAAVKAFCGSQRRSYIIARREARRMYFKCPAGSEVCNFSVRVFPKDSGVWEVGSSNVNHTCGGAVPRARAPPSTVVAAVSRSVESFVPQPRSTGNAAQLVTMAKSDGVELKRAQARNIVIKKSNASMEAAFAEWAMLEDFVAQLRVQDTISTFSLVISDALVDDQPERQVVTFYVAPMSSKLAFNTSGQRTIVAVDGTYLTGPLRGTLLTAVTKNAHDRLVLLAWAHVEQETEATWSRFLVQLCIDYPRITVVLCDKQKGLDAAKKTMALRELTFARCFWHMVKNCGDAVGPLTQDTKDLLYGMGKSTTEAAYFAFCSKARVLNAAAAQWMDERKEEFATFLYLNKGVSRFGDMTSNMAEQINSALRAIDVRGLPVLSLTLSLLRYVGSQVEGNRLLLNKLQSTGMLLMPKALEWISLCRQQSNTLIVTILQSKADEIQAEALSFKSHPARIYAVHLRQVFFSFFFSRFTLFVCLSQAVKDERPVGQYSCPCKAHKEIGSPCKHITAVLDVANVKFPGAWDVMDPKWHHAVRTVAAFSAQLQFPQPAISLFGGFRISKLLPPDIPALGGRPKKKRAVVAREGAKVRHCHACDGVGHYSKSCKTPSIRVMIKYVNVHKYGGLQIKDMFADMPDDWLAESEGEEFDDEDEDDEEE